jgi:cysteinyl-tRNA synthetase
LHQTSLAAIVERCHQPVPACVAVDRSAGAITKGGRPLAAKLSLYNTLGRAVQEFQPLRPGEVGLYACGPTVYNYAHIGNLRTYVFEDVLVRTLRAFGCRVRHVMNVTDVGHLTGDADQGEDKMLKSAREQGRSVWDVARFYTDAFFRDLQKLNICSPDIVCRATDHIPEMIDLVSRLEKRGYTYSAGGNLYFDISRVPDYGKLTGQNLEELRAGARVEVDPSKRNPLDFVLWFTRSKFEHQAMLWDSPWGRGYPGWHVECSAMSMKYLGEEVDIHCGGVDHIPVHHTNEVAQSEAATGRSWVRYWVHGEFLVLARQKMAKSTGHFLTLPALEERGFHPLDFRYLCLGAHYRSQLQFGFEALEAARSARRNLNDRLARLLAEAQAPAGAPVEARPSGPRQPPAGPAPAPSRHLATPSGYLTAFRAHLAADLNAPQGLADLWGCLRDDRLDPALRAREALTMDAILGLGLEAVEPPGVEAELDDELETLIQEREVARRARDFPRADEIRAALRQRGIVLEDTPAGVRWHREKSR